jgi:SAM-dependent methyltransferase
MWSAAFGSLLLQHIPLGPGAMRVLDVGCGTGFPSIELAQRLGPGSVVHGLDVWTAALERARFKADVYGIANVVFHDADAAALPFAGGEFDLITSNLGINNFKSRDLVLHECRRVLKPGGKLALTTNLVGHMAEFYEIFRAVLHETADVGALAALDAHEQGRATLESTQHLLCASGFAIERTERDRLRMRFGSGTALFAHSFIKLAFLQEWESVVPQEVRGATFERLEARLNEVAASPGGLELSVPMLFLLAAPSPENQTAAEKQAQ